MSRENLNDWELIAIAITAAMRDDVEPLKKLLANLRKKHDDYTIGTMFMEVGAIVFNDGTEKEEEQNEEE